MIALMRISLAIRVFYGKLAVNISNELRSHGCRIIRAAVKTKIMHFALALHARAPKLSLRIKTDANETRGVVALHHFVAGIVRGIGAPQLTYSVIGSITEFVVNLAWQPLSVDNKPRQNVGGIMHPFSNLNLDISRFGRRSSLLSNITRVPFSRHIGTELPQKKSSLWIVIQNGFNKICGQRCMCLTGHPVSLSLLPCGCNSLNPLK